LIKRFTNNVIMAFDGDSAGFKAASRAIELGLELGLEMKVAELPVGQDPASVCQTNPEQWEKAVAEARHVIDFLLKAIAERESDQRRRAHLIKEEVYPYIARLQQRIDQAFFISQVMALTGLSEEVIRADLREQKSSSRPAVVEVETEIVLTRSGRILERLLGLHWWQKQDLPELVRGHETKFLPRQGELVLQAELIYSHLPPPDLLKEATNLLQSLEIELLLEERAETTRELGKAKEEKEEEKEHQYLKKIDELTRKINDLKNK
jgi:DNA primase